MITTFLICGVIAFVVKVDDKVERLRALQNLKFLNCPNERAKLKRDLKINVAAAMALLAALIAVGLV